MKSDRVLRAVTFFLCIFAVVVITLGVGTASTTGHSGQTLPPPQSVSTTTTTLLKLIPGTLATTAPMPPTISSISPDWALTEGGQEVTIYGAWFNVSSVDVLFGGTAAIDTGVSPDGTKIYCTAPAHAAGTVQVLVDTSGGSASIPFTYLAALPTTTAPPTTAAPTTAPPATTAPTESTTMVTTTAAPVEAEDGGGLSGGWIALIAVLGALVVGAVAYALGKRGKTGGPAA